MRALAVIACLWGAPALAQTAQDCVVAEALLESVIETRETVGGKMSVQNYRDLSQGEKWYFVASKLLAQARRMNAVLTRPTAVANEVLVREARVFQALDATEPCFRDHAGQYAAFTKIPSDNWRADLRARLDEFL